jgi:hypothetical protein
LYRIGDAGTVPEAKGKFVVRDEVGMLVRHLDGLPYLFNTEQDAQAFIKGIENGEYHFTTDKSPITGRL